MAEFRPTFLCGDFNMALFSVIPELRARGFQINLAAWYCWQMNYEATVRADSCGIFRIGPCQGVRLCFDASAFGLQFPMRETCSMVMEIVRDAEGNEIERRRYHIPQFQLLGQGYQLTSYRPQETERREQFVKWTFTPVFEDGSPAMAAIKHSATHDLSLLSPP